MADIAEKKSKFSWIAEFFALAIVFLLPLKFGTLVTVNSITISYSADPIQLLFSIWPVTLLPFAAIFLLLLVLMMGKVRNVRSRESVYACSLLFLSWASFLGFLDPGKSSDYAFGMTSSLGGLACFVWSITLLLERDREFGKKLLFALSAGALFSFASGFYQYFVGYHNLIEKIESAGGPNTKLLARIREFRVSADFSSCNAYAGYLVLILPVLCAVFWKSAEKYGTAFYTVTVFLFVLLPILVFGSVESLLISVLTGAVFLCILKLTRLSVSRFVMTSLAGAAALTLLILTGSRGAVLALFAGVLFLLLTLGLPRKLKIFLASLLPAGGGTAALLLSIGRGGDSIFFRLDYFQAAFRMMLSEPLTGVGWGNFQKLFLLMRRIADPEAPNSPHNFLLSFGSQTGISGFLIALFVLFFPIICAWLHFRKKSFQEAFSGAEIIGTALFLGVLSWSIQSLLDVSLETAGSTFLACTCALLLPGAWREGKSPAFLKYLLCALAVTGTLFTAIPQLRHDFALSKLNDFLEMNAKEESPETELFHLVQTCEKENPSSPAHWISLLNFMESTGAEDREKLRILDLAIERDPRCASYYDRRYRILKHTGDEAGAEKARKKAQELAPFDRRYRE